MSEPSAPAKANAGARAGRGPSTRPRALLLKNGTLLTPSRRIEGGGILVLGGLIERIFEGPAEIEAFEAAAAREPRSAAGDPKAAPARGLGGLELIDLGGDFAAPGFIDLHCHGGGGHDFMDATVEAFRGAGALHLEHGTTCLYPTTLASTRESLELALEGFRAARAELSAELCPEFPGLHLEGPYFSQAQRGAQDPRHLRNPDPAEYLPLLERAGEIARWTLAPELPGGLEMGRALAERGILPAIGHSEAGYEEVQRAFDCGFSLVTHLYSGMSGVTRRGGYRRAGLVESAYLVDDLAVELIADGSHLPGSLLRLACKIKRPDRVCLVTDAMRAAGLGEGEYVLGKAGEGRKAIVREGVAWTEDGQAFAGSVATADRLLRTMVELAGLPLETAVSMLSSTPAAVMGIDRRKGRLRAGMDADIAVFDPAFRVRAVIVRGELAKCEYRREGGTAGRGGPERGES